MCDVRLSCRLFALAALLLLVPACGSSDGDDVDFDSAPGVASYHTLQDRPGLPAAWNLTIIASGVCESATAETGDTPALRIGIGFDELYPLIGRHLGYHETEQYPNDVHVRGAEAKLIRSDDGDGDLESSAIEVTVTRNSDDTLKIEYSITLEAGQILQGTLPSVAECNQPETYE